MHIISKGGERTVRLLQAERKALESSLHIVTTLADLDLVEAAAATSVEHVISEFCRSDAEQK